MIWWTQEWNIPYDWAPDMNLIMFTPKFSGVYLIFGGRDCSNWCVLRRNHASDVGTHHFSMVRCGRWKWRWICKPRGLGKQNQWKGTSLNPETRMGVTQNRSIIIICWSKTAILPGMVPKSWGDPQSPWKILGFSMKTIRSLDPSG